MTKTPRPDDRRRRNSSRDLRSTTSAAVTLRVSLLGLAKGIRGRAAATRALCAIPERPRAPARQRFLHSAAAVGKMLVRRDHEQGGPMKQMFRSRGRRNVIYSRITCPKCHQQITTGVSASIRPDGMIGLSWHDQDTGQWCVVAFHVDKVVTGTEPRAELWKQFWSRWGHQRQEQHPWEIRYRPAAQAVGRGHQARRAIAMGEER